MTKVVRTVTNGEIQLSKNFWLSEFTDSDLAERHGINNVPTSPVVIQNLFKLAALMEEVRKVLKDNAIFPSSGYRSPEVNKLAGGSETSDHMRGEACDFRCPGFGTPLQICHAIVKSGIKFGQLIFEGTWVHISLPDGTNDGQVMTAKFVRGADGKTRAVYSQGLPK